MLFLLNKKAKCVIRYHQTGFITQSQISYRTKYAESPLTQNPILRWVQTLANMREYKMHKHRENLQHCPNMRKESLIILSDTKASLYGKQRKIRQFHGAQFMMYSGKDFNFFHRNLKSYSSLKKVIIQLVLSFQTGTCKVSEKIPRL